MKRRYAKTVAYMDVWVKKGHRGWIPLVLVKGATEHFTIQSGQFDKQWPKATVDLLLPVVF
jgi:hypothetical protein